MKHFKPQRAYWHSAVSAIKQVSFSYCWHFCLFGAQRPCRRQSRTLKERERDGDLTSTQITAGIKGGTVHARVAEEIGHFQNSASFLKPSLDKLFMWQ